MSTRLFLQVLSLTVIIAVATMFCSHKITVCSFDGGGTLTVGNAAQTDDGHTWVCTEDGRLVRIQ